ncbi:hypothetical protein QP162_07510 [Sphingomonas aurantiaca]|uniref:hypothetical protein n=1 Tax=Sphingomonas aurantiaca TaxID=185949 RepID=UPI000D3B72B9|nr:hypothetical protein [Sphingomonas aurantiaca]
MSNLGSIRSRGFLLSGRLADQKHRCKLTGHFHLQCPIDRCQHDASDKSADYFLRLRAAGLVGAGRQQILDAVPVDLREPRMEHHGSRRFGTSAQNFLQRYLALAQTAQLLTYQRCIDPLDDGGGQPLDARDDAFKFVAV